MCLTAEITTNMVISFQSKMAKRVERGRETQSAVESDREGFYERMYFIFCRKLLQLKTRVTVD